MKKQSFITSVTVCIIMLLLVGSQVFAQAEHIQKMSFTMPFEGFFFNPITGTNFLFTGEVAVKIHVRIDSDGKYHGNFFYHLVNMSAEDLGSGNVYTVHGVEHQMLFNFYGLPFVTNYRLHCVLINQGDGDDYHMDAQAHLTINANGDVTSEFCSDEWKCL